jgi:ASPIC and UnbV/FG-GAP-like repeat
LHRLAALALAAALPALPAGAQTFTRITVGDAVTDGRYSEGALWGDIDGDGDIDLFVANIVGQDNLVFLNDGAGNLAATDGGAVTSDGGFSYGGCLADFDNDGDPDLYVVNGGASQTVANFLYRNDGGTFTRMTTGAPVTDLGGSWSSSPADYDLDGDLDLFVANFNQNNALYRNDGGLSFTAVTAGPVVTDGGSSLGSCWSDYDDDGDPDLFVFNADFASGVLNFVYRNDGDGAFVRDLSFPLGTAARNSVSGAWGDVDNDGDLDLVVANYASQNNQLFRNDGGGAFANVTPVSGIAAGGASVCPALADWDDDGRLDLFLSNDNNGNNHLFRNTGPLAFTMVTTGAIVTDGGRSNASVWGDVDGDGDLDLYVTNGDQPLTQDNFLYRNDGSGAGNHRLRVRCIGTTSNRAAIGTSVHAKATIGGTPVWQLREISGQTGYNAQAEPVAHFGLGDATVVDSLVVEWPLGLVEVYGNVPADGTVTLTEGTSPTPAPTPLPADAPPGLALGAPFPDPFLSATRITFTLPAPARVVVTLHDVAGRRLRTLRDTPFPAGTHAVPVRGDGLAAGTYFVVVSAGDRSAATVIHRLR